jgi:hypothetical protein
MAAKASREQGKKSKLKQESVKSVWAAYFARRAEADEKRRAKKPKR